MPFNTGNIATFTVGGTDLSPYTTLVTFDAKRDIKSVRPIGGAAVSNVVGPYGVTVTIEGAYDPVVDAALSPMLFTNPPPLEAVTFRPTGSAGRTLSGSGYLASFRVDTPGDDTAKWRAEVAIAGTVTDA